jgi:hypothetical protein
MRKKLSAALNMSGDTRFRVMQLEEAFDGVEADDIEGLPGHMDMPNISDQISDGSYRICNVT